MPIERKDDPDFDIEGPEIDWFPSKPPPATEYTGVTKKYKNNPFDLAVMLIIGIIIGVLI